MSFEFLTPVSDLVVEYAESLPKGTLGHSICVHTKDSGIPELSKIKVVVVGVRENRNDPNRSEDSVSFDAIRKALYGLYPGNWDVVIADIGDVIPGDSINDTYYLVQEILSELLKKDCIPVVIGGGQDLVYAQYRAFDALEQMVNLVNVDSKFDLGDTSAPITNASFVGKIIVEQPYNLFNYSNIGYQTYFNSQEEIDLIEKLYFDAYRLGEVISDITVVEPITRDADIVVVDLGVVDQASLKGMHMSPNGFNGREICAISRYAGISDKVKSFGIYEFRNFAGEEISSLLIAQMVWYFVEGVNYRSGELVIRDSNHVMHYNVPVDDEILSFYKSGKTGRWWIEIPFIASGHNKLKRHTLLPCTYDDYERACNQEIPERWYKAKQKNEV